MKLRPAAEIAAEMVHAITADLGERARGEAILVINGFGATPLSELYLMYDAVRRLLEASRHDRRAFAGRQLRHLARYGRLFGDGVDARRGDEAPLGRSRSYTGFALGNVAVRKTGAYFIAPKRLSNEFEDTIGAEPET